MDKKIRKANANTKEQAKLKKANKEKDKEGNKVKMELANLKAQNDDYRNRIDELIKKQATNRPSGQTYTSNNLTSSTTGGFTGESGDVKKLKQDIADKDTKIKEINSVVS